MPLIILEGLTGAGKSSTLAALQEQLQAEILLIVYEEETFGDLMDELAQAGGGAFAGICRRLEKVLEQISASESDWILLERFHPSYYALCPDWSLYQAIDDRLAALNARLVLLSYAETLVPSRALYRQEREAEGWSRGFVELYGSEAGAIEAFKSSLRQRQQAFKLSRLPGLILDTGDMAWNDHAASILDWAGRS